MPQIDIKLKSSADISGVQQMQAELGRFSSEVQRKFSPANFGKSILSGLGFGSGFSAIQSTVGEFFRSIEEQAKQAQAEMDKFAASVHRVGAAFDAIASKRITNSIESLAPADRIEAQKREIEKLERATAEWRKERDDAARKVAEASTVQGKLMTMWRGSPESGDYSNFLKQFINQEEVDRAIEKWSKDQADIQQRANEGITDAETKIDAANESIRRANKEIEDQKAKDAEAAAKKAKEVADAQLAAAKERAKIEGSIAAINAKITADFQRAANASANAEDAAARKREQDAAAAAAIRAAQDAVTSYDTALQKLAANPYLTDQEKQAQRLALLQQQTQAIKDQQKALDDFVAAHPGVDIGGVTSARAQLGDKETAVAVDAYKTANPDTLANRDQKAMRDMSDPSQHYQNAGDGVAGGLIAQIEQIGTAGDQAARAFQSAFSGATSSIQQGLYGLFSRTQSLGQSLRSIWVGFGQAALNALTQMLAEYAVKKAAMFALDAVYAAKGLALSAANAAKSLIMWIPSAIAASISSWGVAAAIGAAAVIGLVAANNFDVGGFTEKGPRDKPAGVVHAGEWVAPKWMVEDPVYGPTVAALEAARQGAPGYSLGGFIRKFTGWDTAGQFLGSGFIPKWGQPKFFTNFQRDWNLLDGQHLYGEPGKLSTVMDTRSAAQLDYDAMMSPVASLTRPAYQPDLGASGGGSGGGSGGAGDSSGPVINQAFFNTQQDAESWLRSQEGRRFMVDFLKQNAAELS